MVIVDLIWYGVIYFNWFYYFFVFEKKLIFYLNLDKWIIICFSYELVCMMNYKLILNLCDRLEFLVCDFDIYM